MQHTSPIRPRVAVIGAGIVGCATAWSLAQRGAAVTLIDANPGPGEATSLANGAQLSYSYVEPLATPAALRKVPRWLLDPASPLRLRLRADPAQWRWLLRFTLACHQRQVERTTAQLLRLSFESREVLSRWLADATLGPAVRHAVNGKLVLFDSPAALAAASQQVAFQAKHGCAQQVWSVAQCVQHDPALASLARHMVGGVWTADEAVGDAHTLSQQLASRVALAGHSVRLGTRVEALRLFESSRRRGQALRETGWEVKASQGGRPLAPERFDHVVLCTANETARLTRPLGIKVPIEPIKGYSVTLDVVNPAAAPKVSVTDTRRKVVFAPLTDEQGRVQLRVAGMAELVGHDTRVDEGRIRQLVQATEEAFPGACDTSAAADWRPWAGLRPATPTGLPLIGRTPMAGLWLNTGHGSLGFTLAGGSAERLATQLFANALQPVLTNLGGDSASVHPPQWLHEPHPAVPVSFRPSLGGAHLAARARSARDR
jgi:D-amino-acid dehydrogenase